MSIFAAMIASLASRPCSMGTRLQAPIARARGRPGAALSRQSRAEVDQLIERQERRLAELG